MDEAKASRMTGQTPLIVCKPDGWKPEREADHFMLYPVCGEMVDMRRLEQALEHWHNGPETILLLGR